MAFLLALFLAAALSGRAAAQFYVSGYLGAAQTGNAPVRIEQPGSATDLTFTNVPFRGRSFDSPVYYGYRAGVFLRARLGLEAEFVHLKAYAQLDHPVQVQGTLFGTKISEQAPMRRYADQFEVSHGLNLLLANLVFRQPVMAGPRPERHRLLLLLRAGAGPTIPRPEAIILGVPSGEYQLGPAAFQAAGGAEYHLWRRFYLMGEYKYTYTRTRFDIAEGRAGFPIHSHHVVTGLSFYF